MGTKKIHSPSSNFLPPLLLDRNFDLPLAVQIARGLSEAIRGGRLKAGVRLPPSRDAAKQLNVGRNTILEAYDELLSQGLLETRGRLGSFVSPIPHGLVEPDSSKLDRNIYNQQPPSHDWRLGQTNVQLLPLNVWRSACKEAGRNLPPGDYGDPRGEKVLRISISEWLRRQRGVVYEPEQIVVTQGAGAAIDLIAQRLIKPGDQCIVESPGYARASTAIERNGGKIIKLAVDHDGIDIAQHTESARLLHITPSHQYPMGGRLSSARRHAIANFSLQHDTYVIENEYDYEFIFEGQNHLPLASLIPDRSILVGTFSKTISPALRIGFFAAPLEIANSISNEIEKSRLHVSWSPQISVHWLLRSGEMLRHMRRVRLNYAAIRQQLLTAFSHYPRISVKGQEGGLHLIITTNNEKEDRLLSENLRKQGVFFNSLLDFGGTWDTPIMGYGHMNSADAAAALECFNKALD